MFKLAATPKFWATVKVEFKKEDGSTGTAAFDVQYKRLPVADVRALATSLEGADDADLQFMREIVTDWRKVPDDDGNEVPFSPEALRQLYEIGFGGPVVRTYFGFFPKAREKN